MQLCPAAAAATAHCAPDLLRQAANGRVVHLAWVLLRRQGRGARWGQAGPGKPTILHIEQAMQTACKSPPDSLTNCTQSWHIQGGTPESCRQRSLLPVLPHHRTCVMLNTTGSTSRGRMRMMVRVVTSSATRVLGVSLLLSTLERQPTTYRGPLLDLTMTARHGVAHEDVLVPQLHG